MAEDRPDIKKYFKQQSPKTSVQNDAFGLKRWVKGTVVILKKLGVSDFQKKT